MAIGFAIRVPLTNNPSSLGIYIGYTLVCFAPPPPFAHPALLSSPCSPATVFAFGPLTIDSFLLPLHNSPTQAPK